MNTYIKIASDLAVITKSSTALKNNTVVKRLANFSRDEDNKTVTFDIAVYNNHFDAQLDPISRGLNGKEVILDKLASERLRIRLSKGFKVRMKTQITVSYTNEVEIVNRAAEDVLLIKGLGDKLKLRSGSFVIL